MTRSLIPILCGLLLSLTVPRHLAGQEADQKTEDWQRRLEMLRALPYLDLTEAGIDEADTGVVFFDPGRAHSGYNLYVSRRSGYVHLMAMDGQVVHRWDSSGFAARGGYHHVHLLENGDLYIIRENNQLYRVDWNSDLIWAKKFRAHHDIAVLPDDSFYVITRRIEDHQGLRVFFDIILHLDKDGSEVNRWSTYTHLDEIRETLDDRLFLDSILDSIRTGVPTVGGMWTDLRKAIRRPNRNKLDYFHLNTVSIIPSTHLEAWDPRFQKGNLLVCFRNVNQIAILERGTYRILWSWGAGELQWPHQPTLLENGHILIFDNGVDREYSRVIELDPLTEEIVWEYKADPPGSFYTSGGGSAQRFPNGNTLICETNKGRAFEIDRSGAVVWMWLNPMTWRDRRETVYRMTRFSEKMVEPLLNNGEKTHD
jgi:hypothetical protein